RDFIARDDVTFDAIVNDTKMQNEYFAAIDQYVADTNEFFEGFTPGQIKSSRVDSWKETIQQAKNNQSIYDEEKKLFEHDQSVIRGELKTVDNAARFHEISKIISENREDYLKYVESVLSDVMVKPNVKGAKGQRFDRTPEGIASAMASYGGKNALYDEDPFMRKDMDDKLFIIGAAKNYSSFEEVIADAARLQKDAEGTHTKLENGYIKGLARAIADTNNIEDQEAFDKIAQAVDGNATAEAIGKALRNSGLVVDDDIINKIAIAAQEASNVKSKYFEGKPQRALSLDEIDFVSVPKDSPYVTQLKSLLDEKGIKYVEHDSQDIASREAALKAGMQLVNVTESVSIAQDKLTSNLKEAEAVTESTASAQDKLADANKESAEASKKAAQQIEEQASALKEQKITLPNLTRTEHEAVFGDGAIDSLLKSYNISGDAANTIADKFRQAMQLEKATLNDVEYNEAANFDQLNGQFNSCVQEIVDYLMKFGSTVAATDTYLQDFYNYMKGSKIRYGDDDKAEFSSDWGATRKRFSNYLTKSPSALPADTIYMEALDRFPGLLDSTIDNKQGQFKELLSALGRALDAKKSNFDILKPLSEEDRFSVEDDVQKLISSMMDRVHPSTELLETEQQITDAVERTNAARREGAQLNERISNAAKQAADAEEDTFEPIRTLGIDDKSRAINLIRDSESKLGTEYFKDIIDEESLRDKLNDFTTKLMSQDGYELKKLNVQGNQGIVDVQRTTGNMREALHFVYELNNGMLELNENTVRYSATSVKAFDQVQKSMQESFSKYQKSDDIPD
ncbi:MAG: hypothetical protein IJD87_02090, partial [Turicibacter sp.]|nr:hypothetical protein [Turicibacter sp.]